ncbi:MAG: YibE/F family protein, partial [Candidatus Melainabacteria bacterium]
TMINTLILAYAGSSLPTIILITQIDTAYLFNMELFIKELILSAVGSIGLILTIPITSLLAAYLMSKMNDKKKSI